MDNILDSMQSDNRYKDQIMSEIKNHLPDTGPAPEKNLSSLICNREYTKNMKALGKVVALEKHDTIRERTIGEIVIPISQDLGTNMSEATVISIGKDALKYNLNINDTVSYDHFSVFYDHHPNVVTNVENIICKIEDNKHIPIGKYVEVELTDITMEKTYDDIIILEASITKHIYKVITLGTGYDNFKFDVKVGDKILIGGNPANDISVTLEGKKRLFVFTENIVAFYND